MIKVWGFFHQVGFREFQPGARTMPLCKEVAAVGLK